jgi:hypothetical protein
LVVCSGPCALFEDAHAPRQFVEMLEPGAVATEAARFIER